MISNLEYYRLFLAAANLGSATRAADALHLTQSGVSQGIKKLEEELGVSLFVRSRKGLQLTAEGEVLFRHVGKAFKEMTIGERKVRDAVASRKELYSIGATETAIRYFLTEPLKRFRAEYPGTVLQVTGSTVPALCRALKETVIEAAFLFTPIPEEDEYTLIPVASVQDIPVAAADSHFEAKTVEELAASSFITVSGENSVRSLIDRVFNGAGVVLSPQITVMDMKNVLHLVRSGLGVGIVPDVMAEAGLRDGSLRKLPVEELPEKRTLCFAILKDQPLLAVNQRLLDLVREYVRSTEEEKGE